MPPFVALDCEYLPPLAAICHRQLPGFVALLPQCAAQFHRTLTFSYSLPRFFADELACQMMTEMVQQKRGGKAFHSILEPHFDFIHQQRQRRKTWQEIADLLFSEKSIRVTLYATYRFYRRKLKRTVKPNWENTGNHSEVQPARPNLAASRPQSRTSPLPLKPVFKQPNLSTKDTEQFT